MHKMVVLAKAVEGKRDELAKWYDEQHIRDLLAVPGLVTAERHTIIPMKLPPGSPAWDFLLVYELEGNDPMVVLANMAKAQIGLSDIMESTSTLSIVGVSVGVRGQG